MTKETKFKLTEVGLIPEEWGIKNAARSLEIIGGGTPSTNNDEYWCGDIPWISVADFVGEKHWIYDTEKHITQKGLEESATKILQRNQLVISARGTVGEIGQVAKVMVFNQSCYGIDGKNEFDNNFLYYLIKYRIKDILSKTHGSVFSTITRKTFEQILLPHPTFPEQTAIAKILSDLDAKIELLQRQNETLEKIGAAIFKHWFIDFEFPNEHGKPYKSSGGEMVDSELGEIPKGWGIGTIGKLMYIQPGFAFKSKDFKGRGNNRVIKIKNISNGIIDIKNTQYVEEDIIEEIDSKFSICSNDILIAMTGAEVAKIGIVQKTKKKLWLNQRVGLFKDRVEGGKLFGYFFLGSGEMQEFMKNMSYGSAQPNISSSDIENIQTIIPTYKILLIFVQNINKILGKISINLYQIQLLQQIRDSLLPKLMSGKIRVPLDYVANR